MSARSLFAKIRAAALALGRSERTATRKARLLASASYSEFRRLTPEQNVKQGRSPKARHYVLKTTKRVRNATPTISARQLETKRARELYKLTPKQATEARRQGAIRYTAFLVHLLRHRLVQWQVERELAGATNQIHIYGEQLARLRLPHFSKDAYARLAKKLAEAADELTDTRAILRPPGDIINEALCAEFCYPLKEHLDRSRLHQFSATLSKMAGGFTLRNSSGYHHPDFDLTEAFFAQFKHEAVKAFVAVPIRLGSTAEKGDFLEAGAAYYVHPGATKRQEAISLEDCHQVSEEFYKDRSRRFGLRPFDVTINRSGEAVGKVAYYDSDEPALFSDFTMRLRFNARMNPLFAWLYFRSVMFQAQLFRELKGASLPNIFPSQVERLLVVACDRSRQDDLVKSIMADLKKQADAKRKLQDKINEIHVAIESEVVARLQKT